MSKSTRSSSWSWIAFGLFCATVIVVTSVLDVINGLLTLRYWGIQMLLIALGCAIFAFVGTRASSLPAEATGFLAFGVGVVTIIPAMLMGLGQFGSFWVQYFLIAGGLTIGSFLAFAFVYLSRKLNRSNEEER